jgi:hypothetical protein
MVNGYEQFSLEERAAIKQEKGMVHNAITHN